MAEAGAKITATRVVATIAAVVGGTVIMQAALGEDTRPLAVDLGDCVELQSPEERFECYERRVEAARREAASESEREAAAEAQATEAPPPPARAAAPSAEPAAPAAAEPRQEPAQEVLTGRENQDSFGLVERRDSNDTERTEMRGVVASLRETVPNSYLIELENGQIWRQMRPQRYHLRPGHQVRIYSTNWGSAYRLSADELNGFIQVERVR